MYKVRDKARRIALDEAYVGDAAFALDRVPTGSVHLTVTSPPYGNMRAYGGYTFDFDAIARELVRVTADGGVIVWISADQHGSDSHYPGESGTSYRQVLHFQSMGLTIHDTMAAEWPNKLSKQKYRYEQVFDLMWVLCKGRRPRVSHIEQIPCEHAGKVITIRTGHSSDQNGPFRDRGGPRKQVTIGETKPRGNIWRYSTGFLQTSTDTITWDHPCPFPEGLARDHILSWSDPGDVVLDPFCGSGTTCKMAKLERRYWLGFDCCPEYVGMTMARVADHAGYPGEPGSTNKHWRSAKLESISLPRNRPVARVVREEPKPTRSTKQMSYDWRPDEPVYTTSEAASILSRSVDAVRMLARRGRLPWRFKGDGASHHIVFPQAAVNNYSDGRRVSRKTAPKTRRA